MARGSCRHHPRRIGSGERRGRPGIEVGHRALACSGRYRARASAGGTPAPRARRSATAGEHDDDSWRRTPPPHDMPALRLGASRTGRIPSTSASHSPATRARSSPSMPAKAPSSRARAVERIGDGLQGMEGAEPRTGGGEGVERRAIEQPGEVQHHLAGDDGLLPGQLGRDDRRWHRRASRSARATPAGCLPARRSRHEQWLGHRSPASCSARHDVRAPCAPAPERAPAHPPGPTMATRRCVGTPAGRRPA